METTPHKPLPPDNAEPDSNHRHRVTLVDADVFANPDLLLAPTMFLIINWASRDSVFHREVHSDYPSPVLFPTRFLQCPVQRGPRHVKGFR